MFTAFHNQSPLITMTGLTSEVNVKSVIDDCLDGTYSNVSKPHQSSTPILRNCDINGIVTTNGTSMGWSLVFLTPSRLEGDNAHGENCIK